MIYQNNAVENTQNKFSNAIKELQIGKSLRKSNITKAYGIPVFEMFQHLLLLVFQAKNLFHFLNSKHKDQAISKNTYYHFLNKTPTTGRSFYYYLLLRSHRRLLQSI